MHNYLENLKKINFLSQISKKTGFSKFRILLDAIYCYLRYGCNRRQYYVWEFYALRSFQRKKAMTYDRWVKISNKSNDKDYIHFFENKVDFLKTFSNYIYRKWCYPRQNSFEQFLIFWNSCPSIIEKPINAFQGIGVKKIDKKLYMSDDQLVALYDRCVKDDILLEECIVSHPEMCFGSSSVNSLRVHTMIDREGIPHVLKVILKAGVGDNITDNYCNGGVIYPVDLETGIIDACGITHTKERAIYHPGTDICMVGKKIPMHQEMLAKIKEAAMVVPQIRSVGWDIAISKEHVVIIEGNHDPGYEVLENIGEKGFYEKYMNLL